MLAFCRRLLHFALGGLLTPAVVLGCSGTPAALEGAGAVDSTATLVIGDVTYALDVACYTTGDDLTAVGAGTDDTTGEQFKALIRGPASAYVGLMFGDDEYIYEADAKMPLTIERDGDRLTGTDISFVRDIDLGSADGSPVGVGSVRVECKSTNAGVAPTLRSK